MGYRVLADLVMAIHLAFVLFVAFGGLLVIRWRRWAWLHVPAVIWGALMELAGWICPLTPLENHYRRLGGDKGYAGGFINQYITPVLYPEGLTRRDQVVIGLLVLVINCMVYGLVLRIWWKSRTK